MRQDPDWTLPDNSLNMELYYKDHLHLTENGNMKFSKLIIETLQDVLSPQSSQSSSYLPQSSLIRSLSPSSLPRSNLLSVQPLSQSSSSQSLSAAATPFNLKSQIILHNCPTAPPKSQTSTASPSFRQDFFSSLKTNSDQMPSAKPTKLVTSPTSASSSTDTPQSFQVKFQPPSYIPLLFLSTVTSPCTSILSYTHNSLLVFCSSIYILSSPRTSSSIKRTTCDSRSFFTCCKTVTE